MKMRNVENNVENKININGSKWSSLPTMNFEKEGVGVDDHIDPFKDKGITLIALIITIILMLILAGVVISLTLGENGLFSTAKYAVGETKRTQVQEEIQMAVTDILTSYLSGENELTNTILKEEIEKYNTLQGITVDENLEGTYKGYNYYIDEAYTVHIGDKTEQPTIAKIVVNEKNRKITATITDATARINKIEIVNPKGNTIASEEPKEQVTEKTLETIANLSGVYKVKITNDNDEVQEKAITVKRIEIKNKDEMMQFGEMVNSGISFEGDTVTLSQDIDLEGSASNRNWIAIGDVITDEDKNFAGTFEGNNHKISNLYNKDTTQPRQGFFGAINGGTIQNLGIESGNVTGSWNCGGIAGRIDNGKIINCYNKASIKNEVVPSGNEGTSAVGGIAGVALNSGISECYNKGELYAVGDVVGGIVGNLYNSEVSSCYNTANVTTTRKFVGGIIGNMIQQSSMTNCYNKGNVKSTASHVGGIVGGDEAGTEVKNAYSTGTVTSPAIAGGVIGVHNGTLSNLFFINTAGPYYGCGENNTDNGLEESRGSTEATLKGLTSKFNEGQDGTPWKADEYNINGGYPLLSWQKVPNESEENK